MTKEQRTIITKREGINFKTNLKERAKEVARLQQQEVLTKRQQRDQPKTDKSAKEMKSKRKQNIKTMINIKKRENWLQKTQINRRQNLNIGKTHIKQMRSPKKNILKNAEKYI